MYPHDQRDNRKNHQAGLKVFIGADHRGYRLKNKVIDYLTRQGYRVNDVGTHQGGVRCDYPQFSCHVAKGVAADKGARGILVCLTGIGHSIAANKVPGIRAALCYNRQAARLSRSHNDANVLIVGAKFVSQKEILDMVRIWLTTPFAGGRHGRRLRQIRAMEQKLSYAKGGR